MPLPRALPLALAAATLAGCATLLDTRAERREAGWEAAHPPVGQFVTVEGRRVHLVDTGPAGQRRALVLIHGANGNLRDFTFDLVGRLDDRHRVIAVDRPGLGWSDTWGEVDSDPAEQARILRAAVAQLGVTAPVLVGHSYGGAVAMAWALEDPGARAVVLLAGATHPWPGEALGMWYSLNDTALGAPARTMAAALAPGSALEAALAGVFRPAPVPPGYAEHFGPGLSLRRAAQAANTRQVNALLAHVTAMQPRYAGLTLPIEALHGTADTIVGLEIHSRRMAAEVASANLTVIEGAGHMPHHSHPELVVAAIERALTRAAP